MHSLVKTLIILSFLIASLCDIRTRRIPDSVHILTAAAGIVNIICGGINIFGACLSLFFAVLECVLFVRYFKPFGGGDCKMIMSFAFAMGIEKCLFGQVTAFALVSIYGLTLRALKVDFTDKVIPLAPFLSAGFLPTLI